MLKIFIILFTSLSLFSQTIVWDSVEFPPSLITKGELKDQGYSDKARLLISKKLTQFTHKVQYVNSARAINNLKTKQNNCFAGLNKNEKREKFVSFSKPFMYSLPNELIIKKENLYKFKPFIDAQGLIDLEALIKNQNFKLAYTKDRSYSKYIDKVIAKYENNKNIIYRPASDLTKGFLKMLEANRADYIIEYPVMVSYNSNSEFLSFPIKNSSSTFPVYIGCSKTSTGKNIIKEINKVLENNKSLLSSYYASYLDENTKKRYLDDVQK
jgi:uncharacterized protein (TIGR02285 family)